MLSSKHTIAWLHWVSTCVAITFFVVSAPLKADVSFIATLDTEAVKQNVQASDENRRVDSDNIIIRPALTVNYQSKKINGFWRATHNNIRRSLDENSITQNYTDYTYGSNVQLVDTLLTAGVSGGVNYRSSSVNSFLVDDFLLNADNLSKTRTNQANLNFTLPEGDLLAFNSTLNYASTESERNQNGFSGINSDRYSISSQASTGNDFKRLNAFAQSQFSVSKRDRQNDYTSRQLSLQMSYRVLSKLGLIVTATNEGNQIDGNDNVFSNSRNFNTYGAGLTWRESNNKYITITYNTTDGDEINLDSSDSSSEEDDQKGFIGLDALWQFTPRTQVSARYSRRFFGKTGSFSFSHRIKKFRTQISYTDEVTSFSRLISTPDSLGVFVCADGISDLSSCFQPDTLNYTLRPNEQFVQFAQPNTEISDELILRKSLSWQLGVNQRRTRFSINGRYALNEYLESTRTNRTYSAGVVLGFEIGRKTDLSWNTSYAVTDNKVENSSGETKVFTSAVDLSRDIGQHFSTSLSFQYIERETEGDVGGLGRGFGGIEGDLIDRRITLQLRYTLNSD